jgi:predicted esterase YcpF (UPF0227 family)|tara:strand:+ start:435 stop:890 length:456 start_codon:yes stop_codon:yes gene_type:complete
MKKILYLHGLESKQGGTKVSFLAEKGMVYAPEMNYESLNLHEFILTLGMPDLIIGSSMGGYVADVIGSRLGVDVLMFNPALHSREIAVNHEYYSNQYKRTIVLGTEDNIIDPETTKKLWSVHGNEAEYDEVKGMGHRTPLDIFINMYNKHV